MLQGRQRQTKLYSSLIINNFSDRYHLILHILVKFLISDSRRKIWGNPNFILTKDGKSSSFSSEVQNHF